MPSGSRAEVLLVDDDEPVRAVAEATLLDLGYAVRSAASGQQALEMLRQDPPPDVLLTDLAMPGMSGAQLAAAAADVLPNLPVVFVSGRAELPAGTVGAGRRLVQKPFDAAGLHQAIEAALLDGRGAPARGLAVQEG